MEGTQRKYKDIQPRSNIHPVSVDEMLGLSCFLSLLGLCVAGPSARETYDSMSLMVSGAAYPPVWWEERVACMSSLSAGLEATMENAWAGMVEYWGTRGGPGDTWYQCDYNNTSYMRPCGYWFECNCTTQLPIEMDIWQPCNYVSNLAYDRLMVEMCLQQDWAFDTHAVTKITEAFAIVTFGSSFMHGSETHTGTVQDITSNDLFVYILYQASVANIPYNPVIHDLSLEPRGISGQQAVDELLNMYNNTPVSDWATIASAIDMPNIEKSFIGVYGYILTLLVDPEVVDVVALAILDLLGVSADDKDFMFQSYLPAIRQASSHHYLGLRDRIELATNTLATTVKLLFAFLWQEEVIDLNWNTTPEANAFGAALLPLINEYTNAQTSWELHVSDVQRGEGYPGWQQCNPVIPHAEWHVQTAASLADLARLMDSVLRLMSK